ncbi:MAG: dienelactone hydrolase family protein, partial [Pseudomonadales bacterium]|nr:dienelactone hydrolase family protein [Pseudomonadales bacterium]
CDERTLRDAELAERRATTDTGRITRRQLGVAAAGVSLAAVLPKTRAAEALTRSDVRVSTPDGEADCYLAHPATGKHPGVIVWPDILGLRPAFRDMGDRLAASGYAVLTVNP